MINVLYSTTIKTDFTLADFESAMVSFLKKNGITDNVDVELRIVGSQLMRRLNRQFRQKDYATDVLSFPIWPDLKTIQQQPGQRLLGSIVVCLPVAVKQAKEEGQTTQQQIAFLIEHSLLHLMGFHHEGDE